jgi:acyl-homoserine lactone acylase PvdQ
MQAGPRAAHSRTARGGQRRPSETNIPRDRSYFEAYARGVNAYIERIGDRLPIEFRILKYSAEALAAEDSVVIANGGWSKT